MQPNPPFIEDESPEDDIHVEPVAPTSPEFPTFNRAIELLRRKSELKDELQGIDDELKHIQPLVISYLTQHNLPNIPIGGWTLYTQSLLWARPKEKGGTPQVCAAMQKTGFGHFVHDTYNVTTFSAHCRELQKLHAAEIRKGVYNGVEDILPAPLVATLNLTSDVSLRIVRSSKKHSSLEENEE